MGSTFVWTVDTLRPNLVAYPAKLDRAVASAVELNADRAGAYARKKAPWKDRSSNARNGLFTRASHQPLKEHRFVLSHSVPYGIWLEIRWQGKYSIILPTLRVYGKATMESIRKAMSRMGAL